MTFIKSLLLISFILFASSVSPASVRLIFQIKVAEHFTDSAENKAVYNYHELNLLIRDNKIDKQEAQAQLANILQYSKQEFFSQHTGDTTDKNWTFPLENHDYKSIGGKNGNGYYVKQFDYFDMTTPGGHPAQDIFIRDKNQDSKDDFTQKAVGVLSVTPGIVLDIETCWTPDSIWKGGKYIHIYDPVSENIFYYAHNDTILVHAGDIVNKGDLIAYLGRTGTRAYAKRSTTHLHFSQLKLDENGYPRPVNPYRDLIKAKSVCLPWP